MEDPTLSNSWSIENEEKLFDLICRRSGVLVCMTFLARDVLTKTGKEKRYGDGHCSLISHHLIIRKACVCSSFRESKIQGPKVRCCGPAARVRGVGNSSLKPITSVVYNIHVWGVAQLN